MAKNMHPESPAPTPDTSKAPYSDLARIALSSVAVAGYESLYEAGAAPAAELAGRLNLKPNGLYRVLKDLETKGFVRSLKTHDQPTYFYAERLDLALYDHGRFLRGEVAALIRCQLKNYPKVRFR